MIVMSDAGASCLLSSNEKQFIIKVVVLQETSLSYALTLYQTEASVSEPSILGSIRACTVQALQEEHRVDGRRPLDYRALQIKVSHLCP